MTHRPRFAAAVLAAALIVSAAASASPAAAPETYRTRGLSLHVPQGWYVMSSAALPQPYADPRVRLALTSAPTHPTEHGCKLFQFSLSQRDVALIIVEWTRSTTMPPRPKSFTAKSLSLRRSHAIECWDGGGGGVEFDQNGRHLAAYLAVGRFAPAQKLQAALAALNSLHVRSR